MLKLPVLLAILLSCQNTRNHSVEPAAFAPLEKRLVLEAKDQQQAAAARCKVYQIYPPKFMEIIEQDQGGILLDFSFLFNDPHRYNVMIEQLVQIPGLNIILQD